MVTFSVEINCTIMGGKKQTRLKALVFKQGFDDFIRGHALGFRVERPHEAVTQDGIGGAGNVAGVGSRAAVSSRIGLCGKRQKLGRPRARAPGDETAQALGT